MRTIIKVAFSAALLTSAVVIAAQNFDLGQLQRGMATFEPQHLLVVMSAIAISSLLASLRIRSIALSLGYEVTLRDSVAVLSLGQLGGAIFFQVFGQLAARGSYLAKRNVPFAGTVIITAQERIAAAFVSLGLAVIGALYLFRQLTFDLAAGGLDLIRILVGLTLAGTLSALVWRRELKQAAAKFTWADGRSVLKAMLFSGAVQITMMAAYVAASKAIAPTSGLADLAAASSLVMFAASIPISFAGWGVREISAVGALGAIGMTAPAALTVAVTIGVLSIICAAVLAAISMTHIKSSTPKPESASPAAGAMHEEALNAALPAMVACLVFFQIHIPTSTAVININLADPFAVICGVLFLLHAWRVGTPEWRIKKLDLYIVAMTAVMTIGLFIGAAEIGWTMWAVVNKYLGWFVLLAYGAAGAMGARVNLDKTLLTFAATGCCVITLAILDLLLGRAGLVNSHQFNGFAQNVNAMAFLALMLLAVGLTLPRYMMVAITLALMAIILTGSRAGMGAAGVMLITAAILIRGSSRDLIFAVSIAVLVTHFLTLGGGNAAVANIAFIRPSSDAEHWTTVKDGLRMFSSSMVWGAGLGAFIAQWKGDYPLIIHNSAVWILAEFGTAGAIAFFAPAILIAYRELRRFRRNDTSGYLLILILAGFGAMSLFHELLYQRSMWFLFGATLIGAGTLKVDKRPKQII